MLQDMRTWAQGWLAWVIIGFVGIVFVLWGLAGNMGHSANEAVAKVGSDEITSQEFQRVYERFFQQQQAFFAKNNLGMQPNEAQVRQEAFNALVTDRALLLDATHSGVQVTREQVDQVILNLPQFQEDGHFSETKFKEFALALQTTTAALRQQIEHTLAVNMMREALMASEFALPSEITRTMALVDQRRDIGYAIFKQNDYLNKVKLDPAAIEAYYKAHENDYRSPEQLQLNYVRLNRDLLASKLNVTPDQVRAAYEKDKQRYTVPERREVSHILIAVPKDADAATVEKAKQALLEIRKQANKTNFAELAKKDSQDVATKNEGGSLGWVVQAELDPKLDKAVFAMSEGQISEPVRTDYGWHLIYLSKLEPAKTDPLTPALSEQITTELKNQTVQEQMAKRLEDLATLSYQTQDSLQEAADAVGTKLGETAFFGRKGGADFTADPKVLRAAFSDEVLTQRLNSEVIELGKDDYVVVRVAAYKPSVVQPFNTVAKQVTDDASRASAAELAKADGEKFKAALNKSGNAEELSKQFNVSWQTSTNIYRDNRELQPPLVQVAFDAPKPENNKPSVAQIIKTPSGDYAVEQVLAANPGDASRNTDQVRAEFRQNIAQSMAVLDYEAYVKYALENAKIKIYDKRLQRPGLKSVFE